MACVFVTVGTTYFDGLIEMTNTPEFHAALWKLGYRNLVVQYGCGTVVPTTPSSTSVRKASTEMEFDDTDTESLKLEAFRYQTNINHYISEANLVIGHGGAGTCMEALTPSGSRRLIIVINDTLSNNHQEELACTLESGRYALVTRTSGLIPLLRYGLPDSDSFPSDVKQLFNPSLTPEQAGFIGFQRGRPDRLISFLDTLFV